MFELDINKIKEQSMQFVDTAYKAAMDIADKGKNQLDLASQQNRLAKAQRQLKLPRLRAPTIPPPTTMTPPA